MDIYQHKITHYELLNGITLYYGTTDILFVSLLSSASLSICGKNALLINK